MVTTCSYHCLVEAVSQLHVDYKSSKTFVFRNDDISAESYPEPGGRLSSAYFLNASSHPLAPLHQHAANVSSGSTPSPLMAGSRQNQSKDIIMRQPSAAGKKGRGRPVARLMPLDRYVDVSRSVKSF